MLHLGFRNRPKELAAHFDLLRPAHQSNYILLSGTIGNLPKPFARLPSRKYAQPKTRSGISTTSRIGRARGHSMGSLSSAGGRMPILFDSIACPHNGILR